VKNNVRNNFSTRLATTFVLLSIVSAGILLISLYFYLSKQAETEFKKGLLIKQDQTEKLIDTRFMQIRDNIRSIVNDNIVRATLLLRANNKLAERIKTAYPPNNGTFYFVQKNLYTPLSPESYAGLSQDTINFAVRNQPHGKPVVIDNRTKIIWWFSAPIKDGDKMMGTGVCLYDITEDKKLLKSIHETVNGYIVALNGNSFFNLNNGKILRTDYRVQAHLNHPLSLADKSDCIISNIHGLKDLYLLSSRKDLTQKKKKIASLMFLFSILVMLSATIIALFLSNLMVKPLKQITQKAIAISQGNRDILFDTETMWFAEFEQLSRTFNLMLSKLKDSEEESRYRELLENVDDAVYIFDKDGVIIEANEAASSYIDVTHKEFIGTNIHSIIPEQDCIQILRQNETDSKNSARNKITIETCILRKNGSSLPVEIVSRSITYRGKEVFLNVARDITMRIEAQNALKKSEQRYRMVVENSNDGIILIDDNFKVQYTNRVVPQIMGYSTDEMKGTDFRQYLADKNLLSNINDLGNHDKHKNSSDEYTIITKNGEKKRVRIRTNRYKNSDGTNMTVAFLLDITEQVKILEEKRELEEQLIHAQKMEAIGTLAGGIAHDFNNILMEIQGHISMMFLNADKDNPLNKDIIEIQNSVKSASNFTRQLLNFARKEKSNTIPISINEIVEKSSIIFSSSKKEIVIHKELQKDIPYINANPEQIKQALINLYVNAWQAMDGNGEIFIKTKDISLTDDFCYPFGLAGGQYVNISIRDTGPGIPPDTINRIFEPFFTTKQSGKGTGLGLTLTYKTVTSHKGIIRVKSKEKKGTTFNIYLPVATSGKEQARKKRAKNI